MVLEKRQAVECPVVSGKSGINVRNLTTVISLTILVGSEIFGVALAAAWAIAGWWNLGDMVERGLMGLFSLIGLYALVVFLRKAISVEPITRS
jgi:hypothetical protein